VETLADLKPDMVLEGTVTNVTNFGAFVDIGVHQDGLVHISQLADQFVKDPHAVVKTGDLVKVKVLEVDIPRKRIALTMRLAERAEPASRNDRQGQGRPQRPQQQPSRQPDRRTTDRQPQQQKPPSSGAMADALAKALKR
jgi:uncharacterized protein